MPPSYSLVISCEHAGNVVPDRYRHLFNQAEDVLQSHRGWDPGAYDWALFIGAKFNVPVQAMPVTRLLIEMNRSLDNPDLFSAYTITLPEQEKQELLTQYYFPYRTSLEKAILSAGKPVVHLSVHSFTPVLNGVVRSVDIGLLFDPEREKEVEFCHALASGLTRQLPDFRIRFNEPYTGTDDGIAPAMRKKFPGNDYLGIELEVNQRFVNTPQSNRLQEALAESLQELISR